MQGRLVVKDDMMVNFPLVPLPLVSFPCSSCYKVLYAKKKLNNHAQRPSIMHTRLIYFLKKILFIGDSFEYFPSSYTCKTPGNAFWSGESLLSHQITRHSSFCLARRPSATIVARTSQEIPACLNSCWWSMELATPPKYCMKDTWPS